MSDRSLEFAQFVGHYKNAKLATSGSSSVDKTKVATSSVKNNTAFNEAAADIARGVHKASGLLSKLTNLVRRQGLFDDPTDEINSLIFRIKQDLDELNTKCDTAQQYIESKKSMFNTSESQSSAHSNKVVSHLKTDLMNTTKDFKTVLEMRSSKMKDQQVRKVELIGKGGLSPMKTLETASKLYNKNESNNNTKTNLAAANSSALVKPSSKALPSPYFYENNNNNNFATPQAFENEQQQQLLLAPIAENQYYDAREKSVTEVEKTIGELGQLFKRLATMISEQQELVERIDEDIESATNNADKAHNLLLKTYEKVSSNRGLYMKIFGILALFVLFFVLFLL